MQTLRLNRARLSGVMVICFAFCAAGVRAFWTGQGKNGFDSLPLGWYLALVLSPMVGLGCLIAMWRVKVGSEWWLWLATMLLAPQLFVWLMAMDGVLHYLGIFNHGLFG